MLIPALYDSDYAVGIADDDMYQMPIFFNQIILNGDDDPFLTNI
jgi:hypothetical protein